ncbi:hypothetical protein V8B97DRAFT_2025420 [Scleroderma yunnanense]
MTLSITEGKESYSHEGSPYVAVSHTISGSQAPTQPQGSSSAAAMEEGRPQTNEAPLSEYRCKAPLKKGWQYMWAKSPSLFNMVFLLDHPGFIQRSLADTQTKNKNRECSTDVEKWRRFSGTYGEDIGNVSLLFKQDTVLLAANVSFLAIQSVDSAPEGLSYLPQRFSYLSLLAALASIVMGSSVRSPRLFTNYGSWYFVTMTLILGFPFELFLYSILFFLLALLSHCAKHEAVVQLVFAGIFGLLVLLCLVSYWLITEPCNDVDSLPRRHQTTHHS